MLTRKVEKVTEIEKRKSYYIIFFSFIYNQNLNLGNKKIYSHIIHKEL